MTVHIVLKVALKNIKQIFFFKNFLKVEIQKINILKKGEFSEKKFE